MDDPLKEIVEVVQSNPSLLHALLFEPDAVASHLKSREAKALVYGIDPRAFIQSLRRSLSYRECGATCRNTQAIGIEAGPGCGSTCGSASCTGTCGNSCGDTCSSSCGDTCASSCTSTTKFTVTEYSQ
jgi:hypothetical protein